jgi:ribonuclease HII
MARREGGRGRIPQEAARRVWAGHRRRLREGGYGLVAGVDEVGYGAWAGPVVAAAMILPLSVRLPGLRDSKELTPARRAALYEVLLEAGFPCSVGLAHVQEVDGLNVFRAARLAMYRAVQVLSPPPEFILMDGHHAPDFGIPCQAVVGGDRLCPPISAASIMAKVYRDRLMERLAAIFPHYDLDRNRGYGTAAHQRALREYGPCPLHRRSFAPVRAAEQLALELQGGGER